MQCKHKYKCKNEYSNIMNYEFLRGLFDIGQQRFLKIVLELKLNGNARFLFKPWDEPFQKIMF